MGDAMLARMWVDNHERVSADLGTAAKPMMAPVAVRDDPLPIVARVLSGVLAVSLATLTLGLAVA